MNDIPLMTVNIPVFQYPVTDIRNFALHKIQFDVRPLDSIAILGESGSGKSTLLKILAGLLRLGQPQQVSMFSQRKQLLMPLSKMKRKECYGQLQIVFQDNVSTLYENETILSSLKHIAKIKHQKFSVVAAIAQQFFNQLRLFSPDRHSNNTYMDTFDELMKKKVNQLSMGMLRRYCLARALLFLDIYTPDQSQYPKLLLLDEISRGLDDQTKQQLIEFVLSVQKKYNLAIIAISHELDFLKAFCQFYYFLFEGLQIPKRYLKKELELPTSQQIKNTYLRRYFLPCEEPISQNNDQQLSDTGCYFQHFYQCPDFNNHCFKDRKENPWICA